MASTKVDGYISRPNHTAPVPRASNTSPSEHSHLCEDQMVDHDVDAPRNLMTLPSHSDAQVCKIVLSMMFIMDVALLDRTTLEDELVKVT